MAGSLTRTVLRDVFFVCRMFVVGEFRQKIVFVSQLVTLKLFFISKDKQMDAVGDENSTYSWIDLTFS